MSIDWHQVLSAIPDIIQITILYFVIYGLLKAARGSRFGQVLMGVAILFALLIAFTYILNFDVLATIVNAILSYLALSMVVIFQDEIRRGLATIGSVLFAEQRRPETRRTTSPEDLVEILFRLAKAKCGALIAIERAISLRGIETSGVQIDATISPELVATIFHPPTPLHDGGLIIRRRRIAAAHCTFPVSSSSSESLFSSGMRHRAAVGLSEQTDATVLVVSEETGHISVASNGRLQRYPDLGQGTRSALLRWVRKAMPEQKSPSDAFFEWLRTRKLFSFNRPSGNEAQK